LTASLGRKRISSVFSQLPAGEAYQAQLAVEETTATVMAGRRAAIEPGAVLFAASSHRTLQRGRKTPDAAEQETNQGRGKEVERKSLKADFTSQLANPAQYAGFAPSHRLDDSWMDL
jgi:hypothetical protein